jgi:hypothetical protein
MVFAPANPGGHLLTTQQLLRDLAAAGALIGGEDRGGAPSSVVRR